MDLGMGIGIAGGSVSLASVIISFVVWSLKRNVQHEDQWKIDQAARVSKLDARVTEEVGTIEESVEGITKGIDDDLRRLKDADAKRNVEHSQLQGEVRNLTTTLGELRNAIHSLGSTLDVTRDKQSAFYREELEKFSITMRGELSRHLHPEMPEKVARLETKLDSLSRDFDNQRPAPRRRKK